MVNVSIIIPVYNAALFVTEAVESALAQPETAEVMLAEDGSEDDSLTVCQSLAEKYPNVHLVRHPNGENRGAGATRNLAIRLSTCPYIAFLDADDYFLSERFVVAQQLFDQFPEIDGVYEAIGTHFQNDAARQQWLAHGPESRFSSLTTMTTSVTPQDLFQTLVQGGKGAFSGDGLVVKRSIFDKTGLFDENLRLHQDTAMWIKMAAIGRLVPGRLETPVAMRRVHEQNRIAAPRSEMKRRKDILVLWRTVWRWSKQNLAIWQQEMLFEAFLKKLFWDSRDLPKIIRRARNLIHMSVLPVGYPDLLSTPYFWKLYLSRWIYFVGLSRIITSTTRLRQRNKDMRSNIID